MALWPFRKRRKTKTAEGKNSVVQDPPTVERKLSLLRKASTRQNPRRSASRRRVAAATTNARELSYISPSPVPDFPLPPGRNPSPTDPMDANFQLDPNFQPQKRSHEGGFSSYFVEIDRPMTGSSTSSARRHKPTSIVRKLSKRGRESKQPQTQPPPSAYIQQLARSASKRDGKRMRSFSSFEYDRPMSQSSLPPRQSLSSSVSSVSSMRAYRIHSFELFTPRPRLRYDSGSGSSPESKHGQVSDVTPSRSNSRSNHERRQKDRVGGRSHSRARVDKLADGMDAKELREAMDRDRRRRDRRKLQEQERMQRKLERKQMKQREQEQMDLSMDMEVDQDMDKHFQHSFERNQGMFEAPPERQVGESSKAAATYGGFSPVHNPYPFPEVDELGRPTSMGTTNSPLSWLNDPSSEDINKDVRFSGPRVGMVTPVSMDSAEYMSEEPTFDTAKKVNVTSHSHVQISPIHSRSNSKSEKVPKAQVDSLTVHDGITFGKPVELEEVDDEQDSRRGKQSAWTSFIKKATAARIQKEQDSRDTQAGQSALVSDSEEGEGLGIVEEPVRQDFYDVEQLRHRAGQTPGRYIPDELAFAMTALETGHVRGKDEIEDERRDHFSPTPLTSYPHYGRPSSSKSSLGPSLHRPQNSPRGNHAGSSHSHTPELHEDSPTIPAQILRTSSQQSYPRPPSIQRYSPSVHRYSSGATSPENGPRSIMSTSLASIDSEGSWLSGRMANPRQSVNQISPLRTSATSLRRRYKEFDDGASIDGDDYFSGVEPRRPRNQNGDEEYIYQTRMELSDVGDSEDDDENASIDSEAERKMWREGRGKKVVVQEVATLPSVGALKGLGCENNEGMAGSKAQSNEEFMTLEHLHARGAQSLGISASMEHPAVRKSTVAEIVGAGRH